MMSIRAEATARGVPYSRVQRERARLVAESPAATESPAEPVTTESPADSLIKHDSLALESAAEIPPEQARQAHFLHYVLRLSPATVAGHVGLDEATVVRALADDAPAVRLSNP